MKWPLKSQPVSKPDTPFFNMMYLSARGQGGLDSTIVWTTEIEWDPLQSYIQKYNRRHSRFISTSHVLVQAVGQALAKHPEINRRVVGRKVYEFAKCNVCLASRVPNNVEVNVIQIHDADQKLLHQIAYVVLKKQLEFIRRKSPEGRDLSRLRCWPAWLFRSVFRTIDWLDGKIRLPVWGRLDRLRESVVLVNDFSNARFPVMRAYKPSRQPGESKPLSVTLGRSEEKVCWREGKPAMQRVAPLTVRIDHRICDGFQLAQFIQTMIQFMSEPEQMEQQILEPSTRDAQPMVNNVERQRRSA